MVSTYRFFSFICYGSVAIFDDCFCCENCCFTRHKNVLHTLSLSINKKQTQPHIFTLQNTFYRVANSFLILAFDDCARKNYCGERILSSLQIP